jgi:hypothetical protein
VLWHLIYAYSHQLHLDPYAVAAVSIAEGGGRFGAVGDGGTSYGPFQLHRGGELPRTEDAAWANSPAGVKYAMTRMAVSGAAGLRGLAAIRSIVTRFERPAAPGPEVRGSLATYQGWNGSGGPLADTGNASYQSTGGGLGFSPKQLAAFQRSQSQALAKALAASTTSFKTQLARQQQSQLAQQLSQEAFARIGGAQAAQRNLSANGSGSGLPDSQTVLGA